MFLAVLAVLAGGVYYCWEDLYRNYLAEHWETGLYAGVYFELDEDREEDMTGRAPEEFAGGQRPADVYGVDPDNEGLVKEAGSVKYSVALVDLERYENRPVRIYHIWVKYNEDGEMFARYKYEYSDGPSYILNPEEERYWYMGKEITCEDYAKPEVPESEMERMINEIKGGVGLTLKWVDRWDEESKEIVVEEAGRRLHAHDIELGKEIPYDKFVMEE